MPSLPSLVGLCSSVVDCSVSTPFSTHHNTHTHRQAGRDFGILFFARHHFLGYFLFPFLSLLVSRRTQANVTLLLDSLIRLLLLLLLLLFFCCCCSSYCPLITAIMHIGAHCTGKYILTSNRSGRKSAMQIAPPLPAALFLGRLAFTDCQFYCSTRRILEKNKCAKKGKGHEAVV